MVLLSHTFVKRSKDDWASTHISASMLISEVKKEGFKKDKLIGDIDDNQDYLLTAIKRLSGSEKLYLLDGHFCLLNAQGQVQRIQLQIFLDLRPHGIILLTEEPAVIAERRKNRDGIDHDIEQIDLFQKEEVTYAGEGLRTVENPSF